MIVEVDNIKYELVTNYKDAFDKNEFCEKYTNYFYGYDYIVGDYSYGKLRLKGFNKKNNKLFKKVNDFRGLDKYLKENCAYECKYFVLQKKSV